MTLLERLPLLECVCQMILTRCCSAVIELNIRKAIHRTLEIATSATLSSIHAHYHSNIHNFLDPSIQATLETKHPQLKEIQ